MATKVKSQRLETWAAAENLGFNPDKRPITGEWQPTEVTPEYVGQQYVDTTENKMYFATWTEAGNREAVWAGGWEFDPNGTYPNLHAGLTDQIYTDENTISNWEWNFRTTAWDVSVPSSGQASINYLMWKMIRTADMVPATFNFTCSAWITITGFNKYKYISAAGNASQTMLMTLSGWNWDYSLSSYWITVELATGTTDWTITIVQTAEDAGTLVPMKPRRIMGTGVNQIWTPGRWRIDSATIQDGQIVAWVNFVYFVRAYGWVTNGYMARDLNWQIVTVWRCQDRPDFNSQVMQENIQWDEYQKWMTFEQTWWFVVEDTNDYHPEYGTDCWFSIHPRRSNQQADNTDGFTSSSCEFPVYDSNRSNLPIYAYWMPSLWDVADEMNLQTWKYTKRIQREGIDYQLLATLLDNWTVFDYDANYVYYVKETPDVLNIEKQWYISSYTANDYWTEWLVDIDWNMIDAPMIVSTSYWANLVDKLRTWVASKDQLSRVMFQQQYNSLSEEQKNSWAITFIYTADKPDNFDVISTLWTFPSSWIWNESSFTLAMNLSPAWYPFDVTATSDNNSVLEVTGTPFISDTQVSCNLTVRWFWTVTLSVTIWWVTKTGVRVLNEEQ